MHSVKKVETLWPLNSNKVVKMALKNDKTKIFPIGVLEGQWYTGKKIRQMWAEWAVYMECVRGVSGVSWDTPIFQDLLYEFHQKKFQKSYVL